jgi:ferredoxin-NADP reductase
VTVLYSTRSLDRVIFGDELASAAGFDVRTHLTRRGAPGFVSGRITADAIADAVADTSPSVFVCGPTAFVESMAQHLIGLGLDPKAIRTERFG